jgi:hypothetical protein
MRPEQTPAFDADLDHVAGVVQDDLCRRTVWLLHAHRKKAMDRPAVRRMPIGFRSDDPVLASTEMSLEMLSSGVVRV